MDVAIPTQEPMTPEAAFKRLEEWYVKQGQLKKLKAHEHLERVELVGFYFRSPKEGTNRLALGDGYDLKLQHGYNYKVTNEDLDQVKAADIKRLKLPWDELFKFEPKLVKPVYNGLSKEQKDFVDQLLEITDASPQLEIVATANREAQAEHAAAAEVALASSVSCGMEIVTDPEAAQPGHFYNDGETWWQLGEDIEWVEVVDADSIELLTKLAEDAAPAPAAPKRRSRKAAK